MSDFKRFIFNLKKSYIGSTRSFIEYARRYIINHGKTEELFGIKDEYKRVKFEIYELEDLIIREVRNGY